MSLSIACVATTSRGICGAKSDALLCRDHTAVLRRTIAQMPARIRDLELTATRQSRADRTPSQTRPAPPEHAQADEEERLIPSHLRSRMGRITLPTTSLPFTGDAAKLHAQAVNAVSSWARHVAETRGVPGPAAEHPMLVPFAACTWLVAHIDSVRLDVAAGEMFTNAVELEASIDAAVDRTDPDLYAGKCDRDDVRADLIDGRVVTRTATCGAELFYRLEDKTITCQTCGAEYPAAERKRLLLDAVDDRWARPQVIADALTTLDERLNASTLRTWIQRDAGDHEKPPHRRATHPLILQVGIDDEGRALFRVGDVRARIAWIKTERTERMSA